MFIVENVQDISKYFNFLKFYHTENVYILLYNFTTYILCMTHTHMFRSLSIELFYNLEFKQSKWLTFFYNHFVVLATFFFPVYINRLN